MWQTTHYYIMRYAADQLIIEQKDCKEEFSIHQKSLLVPQFEARLWLRMKAEQFAY